MRLTRAAQRAQQGPDETPDAIDPIERAPLIETSPNTSPEQIQPHETLPKKTPGKKAKGKGGAKKVAKGKKDKTATDEEHVQESLEDECDAAGSLASHVAPQELANEASDDVTPTPVSDERAASPSPNTVRLTRRQLAMEEEDTRSLGRPTSPPPASASVAQDEKDEPLAPAHSDQDPDAGAEGVITGAQENETVLTLDESSVEPEASHESDTKSVAVETDVVVGESDPVSVVLDEQEGDEVVSSVELSSVPEPKTLATEKPCEELTPIANRTPRRASRSPSKSPMRIEESFEAIDALEEALENVDAVTSFTHKIDEKSPRKKAVPKITDTPNARAKTPRKTPVAASRISRAPSAVPKSIKPTKTALARASSVRVAPTKDVRNPSTDAVDYLASKRRPISVSFPTPPPPPKGRAATKPTFQLSSNDVVAKLKAQKEERLKREAEGVLPKQRPMSMPPPAKSSKPPTRSNFQLPGEKIAEKLKAQKEERLKRAAEAPRQSLARPLSMPPAPLKSTKPPTKASFQLPGAAVAEKLKAQKEERLKRQEEAEAAKKEAASKARPAPVRKPIALPVRNTSGISIPPPTQTQVQRSSSLASKRSSIILSQSRSTSTSSTNRNSVLVAKSIVTPVDAAVQRVKGREVFNRDKMEKEARERERREKEDAAKKARADAAERGRVASREWAEKQKKKMMAA